MAQAIQEWPEVSVDRAPERPLVLGSMQRPAITERPGDELRHRIVFFEIEPLLYGALVPLDPGDVRVVDLVVSVDGAAEMRTRAQADAELPPGELIVEVAFELVPSRNGVQTL